MMKILVAKMNVLLLSRCLVAVKLETCRCKGAGERLGEDGGFVLAG